jgi:hypothetical protein
MKKPLISSLLYVSFFLPLLASAGEPVTSSSTILASTTEQNINLCIASSTKASTDAKEAAKTTYDKAKAAAMKMRVSALSTASGLPAASSTEKRGLLKNAVNNYVSALTAAVKNQESSRKIAQQTFQTSLKFCKTIAKENDKENILDKTAAIKKGEQTLNEKKNDEVKGLKKETTAGNIKVGNKKSEEVHGNTKIATTTIKHSK